MTFIVKPLSINDLTAMKQRGEKITCLTAYDASFGALIDRTGIDMMLVGDSLGMTMQGHTTTLPVTIRDMVYHARCVSRARQRAFVVADLPFMSYPCAATAAANAAKLMQAGGVQMVKLEGARLDIVSFLVQQGIPVCGHLGLLPQHINQLGSYAVQGKEPAAADKILADALSLQQAGAALLVLECVPATLAKAIASHCTSRSSVLAPGSIVTVKCWCCKICSISAAANARALSKILCRRLGRSQGRYWLIITPSNKALSQPPNTAFSPSCK